MLPITCGAISRNKCCVSASNTRKIVPKEAPTTLEAMLSCCSVGVCLPKIGRSETSIHNHEHSHEVPCDRRDLGWPQNPQLLRHCSRSLHSEIAKDHHVESKQHVPEVIFIVKSLLLSSQPWAGRDTPMAVCVE